MLIQMEIEEGLIENDAKSSKYRELFENREFKAAFKNRDFLAEVRALTELVASYGEESLEKAKPQIKEYLKASQDTLNGRKGAFQQPEEALDLFLAYIYFGERGFNKEQAFLDKKTLRDDPEIATIVGEMLLTLLKRAKFNFFANPDNTAARIANLLEVPKFFPLEPPELFRHLEAAFFSAIEESLDVSDKAAMKEGLEAARNEEEANLAKAEGRVKRALSAEELQRLKISYLKNLICIYRKRIWNEASLKHYKNRTKDGQFKLDDLMTTMTRTSLRHYAIDALAIEARRSRSSSGNPELTSQFKQFAENYTKSLEPKKSPIPVRNAGAIMEART